MENIYLLRLCIHATKGYPVCYEIIAVSANKELIFSRAEELAIRNGSSLNSGKWYEIIVFDNASGEFSDGYLASNESGSVRFLKSSCQLKIF